MISKILDIFEKYPAEDPDNLLTYGYIACFIWMLAEIVKVII